LKLPKIATDFTIDNLSNLLVLNPIPSTMRDYSRLSENLESDGSNIAGVLAAFYGEATVEEVTVQAESTSTSVQSQQQFPFSPQPKSPAAAVLPQFSNPPPPSFNQDLPEAFRERMEKMMEGKDPAVRERIEMMMQRMREQSAGGFE
jgi:type II secretory pathway component GspD/PulD (secretin)